MSETRMKKAVAMAVAATATVLGLASCTSAADTASRNLSTAADNFDAAMGARPARRGRRVRAPS